MTVLFIKQGVHSYGHIEAGIQRAARNIPNLEMILVDLPALYLSQRGPLRKQPHAVRMNETVGDVLRQVLEHDIEVVLLLNGFVLQRHYPGFFATLRNAKKTIVSWQIDDPYYVDKARSFAADLDVILTVDSSALPLYQALRKKTGFLPLACDPELHRGYDDLSEAYRCDVCFVGTPFSGSRRTRLIDELAGCLAKYDTRIIGATGLDSWRTSLTRFEEIKGAIHDVRIGPTQAARYFSGARISLNIHKDSYGHAWDRNAGRLEARSPAERTFAIAGCGGFQLIDDARPDLVDLFEVGRELVTFSDARDLAAKIEHYLKHEDERREIARAGQQRAYAAHTYRHRLEALLALL